MRAHCAAAGAYRLSKSEIRWIDREAQRPLSPDENEALRFQVAEQQEALRKSRQGAPVSVHGLRRLYQAERRQPHPHLTMTIAWTLQWLTTHCDAQTGYLVGVAQGAIAQGVSDLAAVEGRTVHPRSVRRALSWLEDEGAIGRRTWHGRGRDGEPSALPCRHSRRYCIALSRRGGGRHHCAWHHGVTNYELRIRTREDFLTFVTGRVANRCARRVAHRGALVGQSTRMSVGHSRSGSPVSRDRKLNQPTSRFRGDSPRESETIDGELRPRAGASGAPTAPEVVTLGDPDSRGVHTGTVTSVVVFGQGCSGGLLQFPGNCSPHEQLCQLSGHPEEQNSQPIEATVRFMLDSSFHMKPLSPSVTLLSLFVTWAQTTT